MKIERSQSAIPGWAAALGLLVILLSMAAIRLDWALGHNEVRSALIITVTAGVIVLVDLIWMRGIFVLRSVLICHSNRPRGNMRLPSFAA